MRASKSKLTVLSAYRQPQFRGGGPPPQPKLAVPPAPPQVTPYTPYPSPWVSVFIIAGVTITSVASMITAFILYLRPAIKAAQSAAETTEQAAKDMQRTADEMEKTAIMFQNDIPLTMQDLQKTSEEWELVGKQVNFLVSQVTRPLSPRPPKPFSSSIPNGPSSDSKSSAKTPDWVGQAGTTTVSLSKRVASDTSSLANSLWSTVNTFRQQLGWTGLSKEAAEEAKRLVYIGRQQQEARSWIAAWRSRSGNVAAAVANRARPSTRLIAAQQRQQDEADLEAVQEMGKILQEQVGVTFEGDHPEEAREAVGAVLAALERAQRAAEEAAASSSALERAIEEAENVGALSSSDEEDDMIPHGEQDVQNKGEMAPSTGRDTASSGNNNAPGRAGEESSIS